jgi:DNA-binding beta-propeller fold protein YncE
LAIKEATAMTSRIRKTAVVLAGVMLAGVMALTGTVASAQSPDAPLQLEAKILLGNVRGRIDHMAVDLKRQRLFVAELGNDAVGVVDLASHKLINTIGGLSEPQGVAYEPSTDTLFVANARDGSVRLFEGNGYKATGRIELGSDADNIRINATTKRVVIGYGSGGLAIVDPATRSKVGNVPLRAHPEAFQIDPDTHRIFVNVPDAYAVVVASDATEKVLTSWPMDQSGNFPMAVDRDLGRILLVFRGSSALTALSMTDGKPIATTETCGDADDLFVDAKRGRIYVSCGTGFVDVFENSGASYRRIARVPTVPGARTSLFVSDLDRLLVAVRAESATPAAIWVFRPVP